jgi:hypothetical protein
MVNKDQVRVRADFIQDLQEVGCIPGTEEFFTILVRDKICKCLSASAANKPFDQYVDEMMLEAAVYHELKTREESK